MNTPNVDTDARAGWTLPLGCSVAAALAFALVLASTGSLKLAGGLILLGAFVGAILLAQGFRFVSVAPAVGLVLASLVLIGVGLAAVHMLNSGVAPAAAAIATIGVAWIGWRRTVVDPRNPRPTRRLNWVAGAGVAFFAMAAAFAIHYSAVSVTADSNRATSLALWAYPSHGHLHVGVEQPAGRNLGPVLIVVTYAGTTAATWRNVDLAPDQTWQAPPLALPRSGAIRVTVRRGGRVIATLSVDSDPGRSADASAAVKKQHGAGHRHQHAPRHDPRKTA
jgi:hypothetical protein